ncbi:hypothetical protein TWF481_004299 [Arthrobotrys musiformis]|uniref:USP domain-containing protein n=1 Tax=Arthrobotrys musiformis TaxID=47236 RepID=A0AAV9WJ54_9PEZI
MSLKVLLSQPILFVPESTTQTTHASAVSVPVSVSSLLSAIPASRTPAIALSGPQGRTEASAGRTSSSLSPPNPLTSAYLSSSRGEGKVYKTVSSVPKKRGYEATELSRPLGGSPIVKRRKVSSDAEVAIRVIADPKLQGRGLQNRSGVHCYRNASLQALGHIPAFRDKIRKHKCARNGCPACSLRGVFRDHFARDGSKVPSHEPKGPLQAIAQSVGPSFARGNRQEDAQEYIGLLLDRLAEKSDAECGLKREISKIFGASKVSEVECVNCGRVSATPSVDDLIVMLNLPQGKKGKRTSLAKCLEDYTKEEFVEDFRCESCGSCGVNKRVRFVTPPKVALISLARFDWEKNKDNRAVSFPEMLNWGEYTRGRFGVSELTAVICHISPRRSYGHYVAYVNMGNGGWLKYDDGKVSRCQGPPTSQEKEAYLLLYSML